MYIKINVIKEIYNL